MEKYIVFLLFIWGMAGCTTLPSQLVRNESAEKLATDHNWKGTLILTDDFTIKAYLPSNLSMSDTLTIYIEGDGLAWINSSTPSLNPTPINPLALKLALRDTSPSVYIGRPCQYVDGSDFRNCTQKYWTSHRFSSEVLHATDQAIDQLKLRFNAKTLTLVGYSGGGAVAALVSAKRNDVIRLITIAGNLDHQSWTNTHQLSPLLGSLNPADYWEQLKKIPQTHFVGGKDLVIGESVARAYAKKFPSNSTLSIIVIPKFDHHCCWEQSWNELRYRVH